MCDVWSVGVEKGDKSLTQTTFFFFTSTCVIFLFFSVTVSQQLFHYSQEGFRPCVSLSLMSLFTSSCVLCGLAPVTVQTCRNVLNICYVIQASDSYWGSSDWEWWAGIVTFLTFMWPRPPQRRRMSSWYTPCHALLRHVWPPMLLLVGAVRQRSWKEKLRAFQTGCCCNLLHTNTFHCPQGSVRTHTHTHTNVFTHKHMHAYT